MNRLETRPKPPLSTPRSTNPLGEASVTIPNDIDWFYPAFMLIIGAHYLPFSLLYGMRIFIPLGASMWMVGLAFALWAPESSVLGAWFTGVALIGVGIWAARQNRLEFRDLAS